VADVKISELPAFSGSIDPTNDELPIVNDSDDETQRINRNTFLNLASQPLGLTDTQSPTNKTFDNTNTVTLKDTLFTLQDNLDTTKQAKFELSGITTATTRTLTVPNANTTIVGTDATQTLTNKTLTSPTINTATIINPTITVDSIAEYTSAHGVTVDGLNIKDGALNTNNSVVTANITDAAVTPAKLLAGTGTGWSWTSWTPTLANITIGNGTVQSAYIQTGKSVNFRITITLGSTTSISSNPSFTLPVAANSNYVPVGDGEMCFNAGYYDASAATVGPLTTFFQSTTICRLLAITTGSTYAGVANVTSAIPVTWATSDRISVQGTYEAA